MTSPGPTTFPGTSTLPGVNGAPITPIVGAGIPARSMWMGLRGRERWVPAPSTGMDISPVGWVAQSTYLNGGMGIRESFASHREYQPTWNPNSRDTLRPIVDMAHGLHGTGLIYFIDPMAADKNVLPIQWSWPALAAHDGPVLFGTSRPAVVPTSSNSLDYPFESAQYTPTTTLASVYLPIPPGHTAWIGWHGSANGTGGLQVTPILIGGSKAPVVLPAVLDIADPTRVNTAFSSDSYQGVEIRFGGGTATAVTIAGVMAQMLRSTATPQPGDFISGQGHSGCRFNGKPSIQALSSAIGRDGLVTMSAKLNEVGDWL